MYSKKIKVYQIGNILFFLIMITVNFLSIYLPLNGRSTKEISDIYHTPFTPAGFTFSIWGIIYLLLLGFVIYQAHGLFKQDNTRPIVKTVGPYFIFSSLANSLWIFAWHYDYIPLAMVIMFILLSTLIIIYLKVNNLKINNFWTKILSVIPFSVYLGWVTIATLANLSSLLIYFNDNWSSQFLTIWAVLMIITGLLITILMVKKRNDIYFAAVAVWANYGILSARINESQSNQPVIITTGATILLIIITIILFYRKN